MKTLVAFCSLFVIVANAFPVFPRIMANMEELTHGGKDIPWHMNEFETFTDIMSGPLYTGTEDYDWFVETTPEPEMLLPQDIHPDEEIKSQAMQAQLEEFMNYLQLDIFGPNGEGNEIVEGGEGFPATTYPYFAPDIMPTTGYWVGAPTSATWLEETTVYPEKQTSGFLQDVVDFTTEGPNVFNAFTTEFAEETSASPYETTAFSTDAQVETTALPEETTALSTDGQEETVGFTSDVPEGTTVPPTEETTDATDEFTEEGITYEI